MPELLRSTSTPRTRIAEVRLAEIARRQSGVVGRRQLLGLGIGEAGIARWVARKRLHRVHPGVYAVGHRGLAIHGRLAAALLYAGPGAALSHQTAAWWWRLHDREPARIHVSTPCRHASLTDVRVHYRPRLAPEVHNRLPVTSVPQTLLDIAATQPFQDLRRALAEADYRNLLDTPAVQTELGRGRRGSAALRRALHLHCPELAQALSVLEVRFIELIERADLPMPEVNAWLAGFKVDALWREARLVVELDGHDAHDAAAAAERDRARELRLRAEGFAVLRYTWQQVTRESKLVLRDVSAALGLR